MKNTCLKKNLTLIMPVVALTILSLLNMYGASHISSLYRTSLLRQSMWILIGFIILFFVYKINLNFLLKYSTLFYWLGCLSLILVLFFGRNINGATSWFKFGPISFQPSELFKFFYLIFMAKMISTSKKKDFGLFVKILIYSFIPCLLIFLEPDTGVVTMYLLMMFGLLWSSGVNKKYTLLLIGTGGLFLILFFSLYFLNRELFTDLFGISFFYRMDRLLSFKNVSSYQLNNALIGVGASGLIGFGLTHRKMYIPEVTTDFVFDLNILNFGLLGGILVTTIYAYILYKLYKEARQAKTEFNKCILYGTFLMMTFQIFEHILMNLGLTPITGITLPFLSYGGSSLISYFLIFGLILKITTNNSSYS